MGIRIITLMMMCMLAESAWAQVANPPVALSPDMPASSLPQPMTAPAAGLPAPASAEAEANPPEAAQPSQTILDTTVPELDDYRSVMFTKEEMGEINTVIQSIKNNEPLPSDVKGDLGVANTESTAYTYPQFYLASIAYHKTGEWVIWLNGQKITSQNQDVIDHLHIDAVNPQQIEFTYSFEPKDRSDFNTKPSDERVKLDPFGRKATVLLQPNQTLSSYNWNIYEGKVLPMVEQGKEKKSLLDLPTINDVFSTPASTQNKDTKQDNAGKTGFEGLINQYKKLDNNMPQ